MLCFKVKGASDFGSEVGVSIRKEAVISQYGIELVTVGIVV